MGHIVAPRFCGLRVSYLHWSLGRISRISRISRTGLQISCGTVAGPGGAARRDGRALFGAVGRAAGRGAAGGGKQWAVWLVSLSLNLHMPHLVTYNEGEARKKRSSR